MVIEYLLHSFLVITVFTKMGDAAVFSSPTPAFVYPTTVIFLNKVFTVNTHDVYLLYYCNYMSSPGDPTVNAESKESAKGQCFGSQNTVGFFSLSQRSITLSAHIQYFLLS
jgi:hypothetical protein